MADLERQSEFDKLNSICFNALDAAYKVCDVRKNRYVELAHWLHMLLQVRETDLHRICTTFGIEQSRLEADVVAYLERLPRGSNTAPQLAPSIDEIIQEGVLYALLRFRERSVRSGHLLLGALTAKHLKVELESISSQFKKVKVDQILAELQQIVSGSPEDNQGPTDGSSGIAPSEGLSSPNARSAPSGESLTKYCEDLTERARTGKMDPVVGRDAEIRQCRDILMRRRQNNPILTGEAGVGKTAVVEGFAQWIASGQDVPPSLRDVRVLALDIGLLQAGASVKGEFEQRLRQVIDDVQGSPKPIILFIDEAHTLIGAGGTAGQNDAANLLKPALARGQLRTIAATTQAEYKKYFEKDPALTRRFQVVKVDEPDERRALNMIRRLADVLEKNYKLIVHDDALEAAVRLSKRYIPGRQLPDKAVSLIETACARVAVGQYSKPGEIEDAEKDIVAIRTELVLLERDAQVGISNSDRRDELRALVETQTQHLASLVHRFEREKALVVKIIEQRVRLRAVVPEGEVGLSETQRTDGLAEATKLQEQLAEVQGDQPMITAGVDAGTVAGVVSDWTGIPLGRMVRFEIEGVLNLADTLERRVIGQRHALDAIASRIQLSRSGLDNPSRPVGVFMFVGPSGVGKTETAIALAEALYGGAASLITINMSEYTEPHKVSSLMGSPPGYVGYGQGGVLTEAVRRRPYSVVLLDEVEKAHSDVHKVFFQVFDKGIMKDSEGVDIDFKNTIILLTSNAGTEKIVSLCQDPAITPEPEGLVTELREPLLKVFPPALLGRITVIPYYPINDQMMISIIRLQLSKIEMRVREAHKVPFSYDPAIIEIIAQRTTETESGARAIDAIITRQMLPRIARELLERQVAQRSIARVHIGTTGKEFRYDFD